MADWKQLLPPPRTTSLSASCHGAMFFTCGPNEAMVVSGKRHSFSARAPSPREPGSASSLPPAPLRQAFRPPSALQGPLPDFRVGVAPPPTPSSLVPASQRDASSLPPPCRFLSEPPSHGGRRPRLRPALHPADPEVGKESPRPVSSLLLFSLPPLLPSRISLNTLTLNVKSEKVYTRHGVPISVTGIAQVWLSEPFLVSTPPPPV